ncbi:hypothetical protein [Streptomyces sp. NPDC003247]|uniref:hypothetical protein n=1 Tax=Streptomyces sp. NPDC003247 TaxID=3364677 RepID=UPI0036A3DCE3
MKGFSIGLAILGLIGGGVFLFSVKGLYLLPGEVCDGAVQRSVVMRALPNSPSADEWADQGGVGRNFSFACSVSSGDSILSGMVELQQASESAWEDHYGGSGDQRVVRVSQNGVLALAQVEDDDASASVYVPCTVTGTEEDSASQGYSLVADVDVIGETTIDGVKLSQALTDFAYQLTKRAYELARCEDSRDFSAELPRYEDN